MHALRSRWHHLSSKLLFHKLTCLHACIKRSRRDTAQTTELSFQISVSHLFSGFFPLTAASTTVQLFLPTKSSEFAVMREDSYGQGKKKRDGVAAKLARRNILELQPYRCARDDYSDGVLLDANENAFGPTSLPTKNLDPFDNSNSLERYPDPYQAPLKELVATYRGHNLTPANIFVGVGSDEAIDLLIRIFCQPGQTDNICITPPTYGMYKVCAKVNDVKILSAPLTPNFDVDIEKVRDQDMEVKWIRCHKRNNSLLPRWISSRRLRDAPLTDLALFFSPPFQLNLFRLLPQ
jgi:hypothetical protein